MMIRNVALIIALAFLGTLFQEAWGQPADVPGGQAQDSEADRYWQSVERQRKLNTCLKLGRRQCYEKYQAAVEWCLKNWNECFPMIKHAGVYAGAYGEQIAEQCRKELEERCRREAGQ